MSTQQITLSACSVQGHEPGIEERWRPVTDSVRRLVASIDEDLVALWLSLRAGDCLDRQQVGAWRRAFAAEVWRERVTSRETRDGNVSLNPLHHDDRWRGAALELDPQKIGVRDQLVLNDVLDLFEAALGAHDRLLLVVATEPVP